MTRERLCSYCGSKNARTSDHVVPKALYPTDAPAKGKRQVKRITVPACEACNAGWTADEPHFRNVLHISGETTPAVRELWDTKTLRSFYEIDGYKQARDLNRQITMSAAGDHLIYPAKNARVMRIVRKIVRGLCRYHHLRWPVRDEEVWADILKFDVPPEFLEKMTACHADSSIFQYRFAVLDDPEIDSCWEIRFYRRTTFFCVVNRSGE